MTLDLVEDALGGGQLSPLQERGIHGQGHVGTQHRDAVQLAQPVERHKVRHVGGEVCGAIRDVYRIHIVGARDRQGCSGADVGHL